MPQTEPDIESVFGLMFLAIQQQIMANVPEIVWIDQDLGQLEHYETRPSVQFPCVLIDFAEAQAKDESGMVQWLDIVATFRLGFAPFTSAASVTPDVPKKQALQYYEIENKLYKCIHGFDAGECIQAFSRVNVGTEKRNDPYRIRVMNFTTATEDDGAALATMLKETKLLLDIGIENND